MELRQDREEAGRARDGKAVLGRIYNLELFRGEVESRQDQEVGRLLARLKAIEERLSAVE